MDKYIGMISKIPDRSSRMMFLAVLNELEQLKSTKGPPEEMKKMGATAKMPNIISKTS